MAVNPHLDEMDYVRFHSPWWGSLDPDAPEESLRRLQKLNTEQAVEEARRT